MRTGVLYSDTLDAQAPHYAQMMLANAHTIALCSGASSGDGSGGDSSGASCSEASTS